MSWAVERFQQFIRGMDFDVQTDYRSIITLLGNAELDLMRPRIQRLRTRLLRFQLRVLNVLSRDPPTEDAAEFQVDSLEVELSLSNVVRAWGDYTPPGLERQCKHHAED